MMMTDTIYRGRFAPSPSGPLHFGSLVAALGSYLQAKSHNGLWLVRIEDIDPPREVPGAADLILRQLAGHGLEWDESVIWQSQRSEAYDAALAALQQQGRAYFCQCTRAQIKAAGGHYLGACRRAGLGDDGNSLRFLNTEPVMTFQDAHLGEILADRGFACEDFVLRRKDGLYAYHLASVVDDAASAITEVVRGADLLQPTACQLALYHALNLIPPAYLHLPVISTQPGQKLSKQNHAPAIDSACAADNVAKVLGWLNHPLPSELIGAPVSEMLAWAVANWQVSRLPNSQEVLPDEPGSQCAG